MNDAVRPRWKTLWTFLALAGMLLHGFAGPRPGWAAAADSTAPPHTAASLRATLLHGGLRTVAGRSGGVPAVAPGRPRHVALAFGLSAAVPGLGQAYNRQWVKAAVGLAVEAALWTGYVVWREQGLAQRDDYWAFAHAHWSPARYARWLNDYSDYLRLEHNRVIDTPPVSIPTGIDFSNPDGWTSAERAAVRQLFEQIRALEADRGVIFTATGATFSHQLPFFGEQQYYELIGKYFQYAPGWDDYPVWRTEDGTFTAAIDPEAVDASGAKIHVSDRFYRYADDHARANDLLRRASRLSAVFVVNHVLAAFDAAISARLHNNRLASSLSSSLTVGHDAFGAPQTTASLRLSF
ncbi:MAG: hypothetical protein D6685_05090 [Bacteroidetes bacterium]|nr:MAG: hypothetical protein D6685_05090 [Bacteroidota bacterium]